MIPESYIRNWKEHAPWPDWAQVEQDMLICRGIVEIFRHPLLSSVLVFRGGTALHKLFFHPPRRYSEDIDLVQLEAGPIGPIFDALHEVMTPWLGKPQRKQGPGVVNLTYRVESEIAPVKPLRLKVEINSREHFAVMGLNSMDFTMESDWFNHVCQVKTFHLEELLATKMRALYQRRKGRDLFDLWLGLTEGQADPAKVASLFLHYMNASGHAITQKLFRKNLDEKMAHTAFAADLPQLLAPGVPFDWHSGCQEVLNKLAVFLPETNIATIVKATP